MLFDFVIPLLLLTASLKQSASQDEGQAEYENHFYRGDILLTPEQQRTWEATSNPEDPYAPQNAVVRSQRKLWPNAVVPYYLDSRLNNRARSAITAAISDYARLTCVRFIRRTNQADYVRIYPGKGCSSYVGRAKGRQDMSIGKGCENKGIVMHEMFHALGRWHEQSRPDRNQFVRILTANIESGTEDNFEIANPNFVTTQGIPYDIGSIMHYSSKAFSRNGRPTILPKDSRVSSSSLGQRRGLSRRDIQHVKSLYCRDGEPDGSWSTWRSWSRCSRTCNGGTKSRTRTCVGGTNCEGSNIEIRQCRNPTCSMGASWSTWNTWSGCSRTCGNSRRSRTRRCTGGTVCVGKRTQFDDCNRNKCPKDFQLSAPNSTLDDVTTAGTGSGYTPTYDLALLVSAVMSGVLAVVATM